MDIQESRRERISKGALGLVVGLSLILAGIWTGRQLHIVWNIWPSTDGVVVRGGVQEVLQAPYTKGGMPIQRYAPRIEFSYKVGGRDYITGASSVYTADTFDQAAANVARLYSPGTHHPIRYNPGNPREIEFGVIEFGSLAYSFVVLIGGVVLSTMGLKMLVTGYAEHAELASAQVQGIPAPVLPFAARAGREALAGTLRCPACGRPVSVAEHTCPNCLKPLRAA
jgi:hypothetical protein